MTQTQTELAELLGISQPYLNNIYHGRRRPSYKMAKRLQSITMRTHDWWREAKLADIQKHLDRIARRGK